MFSAGVASQGWKEQKEKKDNFRFKFHFQSSFASTQFSCSFESEAKWIIKKMRHFNFYGIPSEILQCLLYPWILLIEDLELRCKIKSCMVRWMWFTKCPTFYGYMEFHVPFTSFRILCGYFDRTDDQRAQFSRGLFLYMRNLLREAIENIRSA